MVMPRDELVGCKMLWTAAEAGDAATITLAGAAPGFMPFPAVLTGLVLSFEIFHTTVPTQREIARGVYTHAGTTLARTKVLANSVTGLPGTRVSFSAGTREVSIVLSPDDLDFIVRDGLTIREGSSFTAGGTFTIDPTDRTHRFIRVLGSVAESDLLTQPMTVSLNPTHTGWEDQVGPLVTVQKLDDSAHAVTITGLGTDLLSTAVIATGGDSQAIWRISNPFRFAADGLSRAQLRAKMISGAGSVGHAATNKVLLYDASNVFLGAAEWAHVHPVADIDFGALVPAYVPVPVGDIDASGTPDSSNFLRGDGIWATPSGLADQAPTVVTSNAVVFPLTNVQRLHLNVDIVSHTAGVDFEVSQAATAPSKWYIRAKHDGCTVSVALNAGSVNGVSGGVARLANGGLAVVEVDSNLGSAPVVLVSGNVIITPSPINSGKTYNNDDDGRDFELVSGASTQTFTAANDYVDGFSVNIFNDSGGTVTVVGVDNNHLLVDNGVLTVKKLSLGLWAFGTGGLTVLDAA